jgi:hypothetical protein
MRVVYSKIRSFLPGGFLFMLAFLVIQPAVHSQVVNETTKKEFNIGVGMFNDFVLSPPSGIKIRTIDQGVDLFALYNLPFGKSNFSFSIGLGMSAHNIFGDFVVNTGKNKDTTLLVKIPSNVAYKRSKMNIVYLEVPLEFNLKTKSDVKITLGGKVGYMVGSHAKYVGDAIDSMYVFKTGSKIKVKQANIPNLQPFSYGPTIRIGYKWIAVNSQFMLSTVFTKNHGPDMTLISVGLVLVPY